jgi:endonuclease-3
VSAKSTKDGLPEAGSAARKSATGNAKPAAVKANAANAKPAAVEAKAGNTKSAAAKAGTAGKKTGAVEKRGAAGASRPEGPATAANGRPEGAEERARAVHERLSRVLPRPRCELHHVDAWTLLVATILSAQSTDRMVNQVTPALFRRYPTPAALGAAPQEEVEALVKSTGFFRNKAKAIREASRLVAERHGGQVPRTMEEMLALPGVARKTANVVLGTAYGLATGITVDTHAGRVARRLGLTRHEDPAKVETDLMALFPRDAWVDTGHRLVLHGRYVCTAKAPRCALCPLNEICPSAEAAPAAELAERELGERHRIETSGQAR